MKFRLDINTLRSIAVLSVVFFHYRILHFQGGFSGVDVFFVISGYLMTRIISEALDQGNFSLKDFYAKRLKRISPALLLLVGTVLLIGFFITFPIDYRETVKNSIASIFFVSNMLYWKNANYFAGPSENNVLLHTWSLSVEWQFYLLYPVFLVYLRKITKSHRTFIWIFSGITLLLTLISFAVTRYDLSASFYFFPTRSWEMLVGGIAFFTEGVLKDNRKKVLVAISGYIFILYSAVLMNKSLAWPGFYTLIPVIGTFLVIFANMNKLTILGLDLMKSAVVQFIGKISYSLYLWHWPVFVIALYIGIPRNWTNLSAEILLSFVLAFLSYRYVETIKYSGSKKILLSMGALSAVATMVMFTNANSIMFKSRSIQLSQYEHDHRQQLDKELRVGECFLLNGNTINDFNCKTCLGINDSTKNVLLIGDSHAAGLTYILGKTFAKMGIQLNQATATGCRPLIPFDGLEGCKDFMTYIYYDYLVKHASEIDGVIITAKWINESDQVTLLKRIETTLHFLDSLHLKYIVIGQSEVYTMSYPYIAAWENEFNTELSKKYILAQSTETNIFLKEHLKSSYVNIYNNSAPQPSPNAEPYMFDYNHITSYGAKIAVEKILADSIGSKFITAIRNSEKKILPNSHLAENINAEKTSLKNN